MGQAAEHLIRSSSMSEARRGGATRRRIQLRRFDHAGEKPPISRNRRASRASPSPARAAQRTFQSTPTSRRNGVEKPMHAPSRLVYSLAMTCAAQTGNLNKVESRENRVASRSQANMPPDLARRPFRRGVPDRGHPQGQTQTRNVACADAGPQGFFMAVPDLESRLRISIQAVADRSYKSGVRAGHFA